MMIDKQQRDFNKRWKEQRFVFPTLTKLQAECWYFMGRNDELRRLSDNEFYTGRMYREPTSDDRKRARQRV